MSSPNLSDAITEFLDSMRARNIKKSTIVNERVVLKQLLTATGNIQVRNLTGRHLDMYFAQYSHLAPGTWNRNIGYLRSFFKWARARRYARPDWNPLEGITTRKHAPREFIFLPREQFSELLDAAKTPRDRIALAIGLYTFQRSGEMQRLRWYDVDEESNRIAVYRSKTENRDWLPMCQELLDEIRRWRFTYAQLAGRTPEPNWYLVPAYSGGQWVKRDGVRQRAPLKLNPTARFSTPNGAVNYALEQLGYTGFAHEGMHTLRRSGGLRLYEELAWNRGHDGALRIVQSMYGHATISTTERYLRLSLETKRRNDLLAGVRMFPAKEAEVHQLGTQISRGA